MVLLSYCEVKVIFTTTLISMTDKSFHPTLAGLRAFVAVAKTQHFGSAATSLGVSQSTLSQALAALWKVWVPVLIDLASVRAGETLVARLAP